MVNKHYVLAVLVTLMSVLTAWGDIVQTFDSSKKYRIESVYALGSSAAVGANHGVNSPLCMATTGTQDADCYWYFISQGSGRYALRNASTNQYITLDDQYTNSPQILRYVHLSSYVEGEASLWYICNTTNDAGEELFYFQSADDESYFFNVRTGTYVLGAYSKSGIPYGLNETFNLYDEEGKQFFTDGGGDDPVEPVVDSTALEPVNDQVLHVYRTDGKVEAIPMQYVATVNGQEPPASGQFSIPNSQLSITTKDGGPTYSYEAYEVDSLSLVAPQKPGFNSFKFNNKFNHHIIEDANGVFEDDTLITVRVVGIGKTLRPSYKLDDDVQAWIGDSLQKSKETRVRFDKDVIYTLARRGQSILRRNLKGDYVVRPYGLDVRVQVDFATDHSNSTYNVPTVYVTTDDGTRITSKNYYWDGKIRIDGAGVFPDLPETAMQIKGRGNTSWTSSGKAPYHFKFETATKVLGLKKGKHWNLIANAQTRSMTSNAVAMKMAQLVETAGFNHEIPVELYINGEYRGSYNLTEKVGLSNNSVDLTDETYATLLELDSYYDETYKFRDNSYNLPVNIKEPDFSEGTSTITQEMVEMSFNRATTALKNKDEYIEYSFDLDYLARYLFVTDFTANVEIGHPKSTFLYNPNIMDSSSPYVFGPVWDFDWAYGYSSNRDYFTTHATIDFWNRTGSTVGFAWAKDQRYCSEKLDKIYYNMWHNFLQDGSLEELIDFCDDYYKFAAPSFTHDNTRWYSGNAQTYATVTDNSKTWLRTRAQYIYNYLSNTLGYAGKDYLEPNGGKPLLGDVNDDGSITTADMVCVLNYMLNLPNEEFEFGQADTDKNDIITVADLIGVRNLIASSGGSSSGGGGVVVSKRFYSLPEAEATLGFGDASYGKDGVSVPLVVNVESGDYSGLQFDLRIPEGLTLDNLDVSRSLPDFDIAIQELETDDSQVSNLNSQISNIKYQTYRVSLYSSARHKLPVGRSELILDLGLADGVQFSNVNAQLCSTSNVLFATSLGEDERSNSRSIEFRTEEPTAINGKSVVNGASGSDVFDMQGRKVKGEADKGIYIINRRKVVR